MTRLRFRNVEAEPSDPVATWPLEALQTALERGDLEDHRRIVAEVAADPWGPVARRVELVLEWSEPYGTAPLMRRAIARARARHERDERRWVADVLSDALATSGLSRRDFAARLGTSPSRLSTYLSGRVVPAATMLARAQRVARGASRNHADVTR